MQRPTNGVGTFLAYSFGFSQINHAYLAVAVDYKVGELDIPIDVSLTVKLLQNPCDLHSDHGHKPLRKPPDHLQQLVQGHPFNRF